MDNVKQISDNLINANDIKQLKQKKLLGWWFLAILITSLIIISKFYMSFYVYIEGEIASENIYYEGSNITYNSEVKTNKAKELVKFQVEDVYVQYDTAYPAVKSETESFMSAVQNIMLSGSYNKREQIVNLLGNNLSEEVFAGLMKVNSEDFDIAKEYVLIHIDKMYSKEVRQGNIENLKLDFKDELGSAGLSNVQKDYISFVWSKIAFKPNYVFDEVATKAVIDLRVSEIKPIQVNVKPGQIIIEKGTVITEEQIEMLDKVGISSNSHSIYTYIAIVLFVLLVYYLLFAYCKRYYNQFVNNQKGVILINILINAFLAISMCLIILNNSVTGTLYGTLGYLVPLSTFAILITILVDYKFSFFMSVIMTVLFAVMSVNQFSYVIVSLCGALFAIHIVGSIKERYQMVSLGLYIGVVNACTIVLLSVIGGQGLAAIWVGIIVGFISGLFASILALGFIPFLENYFGMSTPMRLMELANPSHPLMKKLMLEAPGTYYHSIVVGNLAEAAADAIGADSLLVRVAAYYHDIGKTKRPQYFIENQKIKDNPHNKIAPTMSMLIITAHVKDGVEMAEKAGLPSDVINIIREHHGDSVVKYFYHKACDLDPSGEVRMEDYRYPNPKPQTKESAILMLADSVQASLQAMGLDVPQGQIEAKIHEVIQDKFSDDQFSECNLTFKDLNKIGAAFANAMASIAHHRIDYPTMEELGKKE